MRSNQLKIAQKLNGQTVGVSLRLRSTFAVVVSLIFFLGAGHLLANDWVPKQKDVLLDALRSKDSQFDNLSVEYEKRVERLVDPLMDLINEYPIGTKSGLKSPPGLENMLNTLIRQWELETQYGECEVKYYPNAKLGNVQCRVVETSHPTPRKQFKFKKTRLYLDKETNLPIRSECYGFPARPGDEAPLIEQYTYENLRINSNLTDFDFNRKNPKYRF